MLTRDGLSSIKNILVFVAIVALLTCFYMQTKKGNTVIEKSRIDTVYVPTYIEIPSVESFGYGKQEKVFQKKKDGEINYELSGEVLTLLSQRDSLTALLEKQNVSIPVTLCETIQTTNDSICITYDDVTKKIDYSIKFSPRKIDVPHITETKTIVEEISIWEKIGYGILGASAAIVTMELL